MSKYAEKCARKKIEDLRLLLQKTGLEKGFTNLETIKLSQELDLILNKYMNIENELK